MFRRLRDSICPGNNERAAFIWLTVWRDLAYRAQEGGQPGRINRKKDLSFFTASLAPVADTPEKQQELFSKLSSDDVNFFVPVADSDDLVCPVFANTNSDAQLEHRSKHQRGGDMKAFRANARAARERALQETLLIGADWKTPEGETIDADTIKRIRSLVLVSDGALFKGDRPSYSWTSALVHNALAVVQKHSDAEIDVLMQTIALKRGHPVLEGMTTEKLLAELSGTLEKLR